MPNHAPIATNLATIQKPLLQETTYDRQEQRRLFELIGEFTSEHLDIFDAVIEAIETPLEEMRIVMFHVDGPGGSGKTFLYTRLM